jgi:hypothetical protein
VSPLLCSNRRNFQAQPNPCLRFEKILKQWLLRIGLEVFQNVQCIGQYSVVVSRPKDRTMKAYKDV